VCILPRVQKGSHDDRFNVRVHHPLHAELPGDSIQFIQLEPLAPPRVRQRFERNAYAKPVLLSLRSRDVASEAP
jgi:hypothetical protein